MLSCRLCWRQWNPSHLVVTEVVRISSVILKKYFFSLSLSFLLIFTYSLYYESIAHNADTEHIRQVDRREHFLLFFSSRSFSLFLLLLLLLVLHFLKKKKLNKVTYDNFTAFRTINVLTTNSYSFQNASDTKPWFRKPISSNYQLTTRIFSSSFFLSLFARAYTGMSLGMIRSIAKSNVYIRQNNIHLYFGLL